MGEEVTATLDAEEIIQKQVNSNGQIYLGRDLAGKTVKVAYEIVDDGE